MASSSMSLGVPSEYVHETEALARAEEDQRQQRCVATELEDAYTDKCGGWPIWLSAPVAAAFSWPTCDACTHPLVLVVQIYAPVLAPPPHDRCTSSSSASLSTPDRSRWRVYERALYVMTCVTPFCPRPRVCVLRMCTDRVDESADVASSSSSTPSSSSNLASATAPSSSSRATAAPAKPLVTKALLSDDWGLGGDSDEDDDEDDDDDGEDDDDEDGDDEDAAADANGSPAAPTPAAVPTTAARSSDDEKVAPFRPTGPRWRADPASLPRCVYRPYYIAWQSEPARASSRRTPARAQQHNTTAGSPPRRIDGNEFAHERELLQRYQDELARSQSQSQPQAQQQQQQQLPQQQLRNAQGRARDEIVESELREEYEAVSYDQWFVAFCERVQRCARQVVRYQFNGGALFVPQRASRRQQQLQQRRRRQLQQAQQTNNNDDDDDDQDGDNDDDDDGADDEANGATSGTDDELDDDDDDHHDDAKSAQRARRAHRSVCPMCLCERVFECQLMPNLVNELQLIGDAPQPPRSSAVADSSAASSSPQSTARQHVLERFGRTNGADFLTVFVYVCPRNCGAPDACVLESCVVVANELD